MKSFNSLTLNVLGMITDVVRVDNINNKVLKFLGSLIMLPVLLLFAFIALAIEEPIKYLFFIIIGKSTMKESVIHYKKCLSALFGGF